MWLLLCSGSRSYPFVIRNERIHTVPAVAYTIRRTGWIAAVPECC
jgi:hypothetical protein